MALSKAAMAKAGFKPATRSPRRLIAMVNGLYKVGKSRFGLSGPKPVGYIEIEIGGAEGVVDQFIPEGKEQADDIFTAKIELAEPKPTGDTNDEYIAAVQKTAEDALDHFWEAYRSALENCKTVVIDTGTDLWEIVRLAHFGKLEKIPTLQYKHVNDEMNRILDAGQESKCNLVWIHRLKDQGIVSVGANGKEQWRPGGEYVFQGYKEVPFRCHTVIELWKEEVEEPENPSDLIKFCGQITDSRHNPKAMGQSFTGDFDFADIAMTVFPQSEEADWK